MLPPSTPSIIFSQPSTEDGPAGTPQVNESESSPDIGKGASRYGGDIILECEARDALSEGETETITHRRSLPKLSDPLKTEIPKLNGDPFEHLLAPSIRKDTEQCNAWKDEVQNILIFAGLFSAVVTAFIVESYPLLRSDPNDTVVDLLGLIAERLDSPSTVNTSAPRSSFGENVAFSPSRSDITINVFWFISLVLSLSAALIGIVTLQWLREHQRYDSKLKPQQTLAILRMRIQSLQRWYVPHILAGLPLLLQGALILFFVGMIQFLFTLNPEVAILVTLASMIPLLFLMGTTLLPTLQVYILQNPFGLSINDDVPCPCPYKSPQALIFRQIGVSRAMFKYCSSVFNATYKWCTALVRLIQRILHRQSPIFYSGRDHLRRRLLDNFPLRIGLIARASGDWASIDMTSWLRVRTTYAVSLQMAHREDNDLSTPRTSYHLGSLPPEVYDCTRYSHEITTKSDLTDTSALYDCMKIICCDAIQQFAKFSGPLTTQAHVTDTFFAFARLLQCDDNALRNRKSMYTARFFEDILRNGLTPKVSELLETVLMEACLSSIHGTDNSWLRSTRKEVLEELRLRLLVKRLKVPPLRLLSMNDKDAWLPSSIRDSMSLFCVQQENWAHNSQSVNFLFLVFIDRCYKLTPSQMHHLVGQETATVGFGGPMAYMEAIVSYQNHASIGENVLRLLPFCKSEETQILQRKPFLLLATCFYVDAVCKASYYKEYPPHLLDLLDAIKKCCSISMNTFVSADGWSGLSEAVHAICRCHAAPHAVGS